jgi:hypothetical protein
MLQSFNQVHHTESSFSIPYTGTPFQPHGLQPYSVKMLTKRIHVCAGCRLGFNNENNLPPSPYNICIAHDETRQITPSGKTPFPKKVTAHYHANPSCTWFNDNLFLPQNIINIKSILIISDLIN